MKKCSGNSFQFCEIITFFFLSKTQLHSSKVNFIDLFTSFINCFYVGSKTVETGLEVMYCFILSNDS